MLPEEVEYYISRFPFLSEILSSWDPWDIKSIMETEAHEFLLKRIPTDVYYESQHACFRVWNRVSFVIQGKVYKDTVQTRVERASLVKPGETVYDSLMRFNPEKIEYIIWEDRNLFSNGAGACAKDTYEVTIYRCVDLNRVVNKAQNISPWGPDWMLTK